MQKHSTEISVNSECKFCVLKYDEFTLSNINMTNHDKVDGNMCNYIQFLFKVLRKFSKIKTVVVLQYLQVRLTTYLSHLKNL